MVQRKLVITVAAAVLGATGIGIGAAALANADATSLTSAGSGTYGSAESGRGGAHTTPTAAETAKVTAAVKAKDSAVTVTEVLKDADGSFDVTGTKAGATVRFDVSADAATVTAREGRGGKGGMDGGGSHTPVTGTELTNVTAAVKAKDSAVTVTEVRKDEDGSYDVLGTKAGAAVHLDVSSDLKTVGAATAAREGGRGGHGGPGGGTHTAVTGTELTNVTAAVKAKDSAVTVTEVRKDADGSYDVSGTKVGARVDFDVSSDLKIVTARTQK